MYFHPLLLLIDSAMILEKIILIIVVVSGSLVAATYSMYAEKKVTAFIQDRRGRNRQRSLGILQQLTDGLRLFFKGEVIPNFSSKFLFILGLCVAMLTTIMVSAVIPWGNTVHLFGRTISLQIADVNIGILYIFALVGLGVYGNMIGGWASNNEHSLPGAMRAASQIISYELAMGISIIALVMVSGTLSLKGIVELQKDSTWNFFLQPLGFLIFLICVFAETNRAPFDLPEAENERTVSDKAAGSSMKPGLYLFTEYLNMVLSSAIMVTLYFGGYDIPFVNDSRLVEKIGMNRTALLEGVVLFAKIIGFILFFMWVRWTVPRFRYDQLMNLGWKILLPLALANMLATGLVMLIK